jgi:integrase
MPTNQKSADTHHLRGGSIVLAKRPNTAKWQMRLKRPDGTWEIKSTKTEDLDAAMVVAEDRYADMRFRQKNDLPIDDTRKFEAVAAEYIKTLDELEAIGANKPVHKAYKGILANWLVPFFGATSITAIDDQKLSDYDTYLRNSLGREPAKTTFNSHNVVLRGVFEIAVRKKWVNRNQLPKTSVKGKGKKTQRRPHFENQEWNRLHRVMYGNWRKSGKTWLTNYKREVLRIYVLVLANTGMRPGEEALNLRWKDVDEYRLQTQEKQIGGLVAETADEIPDYVVRFRVAGKTSQYETQGYRYAIARHNVKGWLDELRELTKRTEPDDLLFCTPDGVQIKDTSHMFTDLLVQCDMLEDAGGNNRTLYSLRHMYATMRVRKGVPFQALALQMGTSALMIEQHYAHNTAEEYAALLAS